MSCKYVITTSFPLINALSTGYVLCMFVNIVHGTSQSVVDDMSLAGCSNLNAWVIGLDRRVEAVLVKRLEKAVASWVQAFASQQDDDGNLNGSDGERDGFLSESDGDSSQDLTGLQIECTVHEVLLKNQVNDERTLVG